MEDGRKWPARVYIPSNPNFKQNGKKLLQYYGEFHHVEWASEDNISSFCLAPRNSSKKH